MISLPTVNYSIVEDNDDDLHIDTNDLDVKLTYAEHEMLRDLLLQAMNMMEFASPNQYFDLPISSEFIQRYTLIENLRERIDSAWYDRFCD